MTKICIHCFVSGKVQGVFFRRETQKLAVRLALTGWVRNTEDGRVETVLCGEKESVNKLVRWLSEGPPTAAVYAVEKHSIPYQSFSVFDIT